jgi:hypothetical protein
MKTALLLALLAGCSTQSILVDAHKGVEQRHAALGWKPWPTLGSLCNDDASDGGPVWLPKHNADDELDAGRYWDCRDEEWEKKPDNLYADAGMFYPFNDLDAGFMPIFDGGLLEWGPTPLSLCDMNYRCRSFGWLDEDAGVVTFFPGLKSGRTLDGGIWVRLP